MEIKPDKRLITKQWFVLLTLTFFIALLGILIQLLIPLAKGVSSAQVAAILWPILIICIVLMWVISAPIIVLWIKNLNYRIEEDRVTIFKGILTKQQQNIPYRAVTDFVLRRTLYDRFLNIGSLRIQTAGQGHMETGYEGQFSGLINWDEMHQELRDRLKAIDTHISATTVSHTSEQGSDADIRLLILEELREIRKVLQK